MPAPMTRARGRVSVDESFELEFNEMPSDVDSRRRRCRRRAIYRRERAPSRIDEVFAAWSRTRSSGHAGRSDNRFETREARPPYGPPLHHHPATGTGAVAGDRGLKEPA